MSEYGRNTDLVFCVDATAKMAPYLAEVKEKLLHIPYEYMEQMDENGYELASLRVKVIAFRDFGSDAEPVIESAFFNIPEEGEALKSFVDGISAKGGQGDAACALEAISLALKSDFNTLSLKLHGIIVFAPGSALRLGLRKNYPSYPEGMPRDLNELFEWWERGVPGGSFSPSAGRFVVLAPDVYPWRGMEVMNRFWPIFSNAGHNLGDVDMQTLYDLFIGDF